MSTARAPRSRRQATSETATCSPRSKRQTTSDPAALERARETAFALLAKRDRSIVQMTAALTRAGYSERVCQSTVKQLCVDGWLNDAALVTLRADSIRRLSGLGASGVAERLAREGFSQSLTSATLARQMPAEEELADAIHQVATAQKAGMKDAKKIATRLCRRGFDQGNIASALRDRGFESSFLDMDA
ncbi:MAG: hypothetical protein EXS00_02070 [Phycisphaerales bacterium]|nr:hypothetical protein [Phycisphaerales bacterium]